MRLLLIILLALSTASCATIADYLLKDETGISIDAQLGANENKVDTGIGSLGLDNETSVEVTDSSNVTVTNTDDRYHITTDGDTTVNVYETNKWLYIIFGVYLMGKPALRYFWKWRRGKKRLDPHEHCTYTSIRSSSTDS